MSALETTTLEQIAIRKKRLVTVPDTATVGQALKIMQDSNVTAIPITAPAGKWLGAGASNVVDGHKTQYIGIVSVTDFVAHLGDKGSDLDAALNESVMNLIGGTDESLSMWVLSGRASVTEAFEPMSKGVHRILVTVLSPQFNRDGSTTDELQLYMVTQTDIVRFLFKNIHELGAATRAPIQSLGFANLEMPPVSVLTTTSALEALKIMRSTAVTAVAVVNGSHFANGGGSNPRWGRLVGTLSGSDFRGLDPAIIGQLASWTVEEFLKEASGVGIIRPPVTCQLSTPLIEVLTNAVVTKVHRVWVTAGDGLLVGVVTFSDIIKCVKGLIVVEEP